MVKPEDAEQALATLAAIGMRPEKPSEGWLYKAFDEDVMVDIIFSPVGVAITDEVLARAEMLEVEAQPDACHDARRRARHEAPRAGRELAGLQGGAADRAQPPRADRVGATCARARPARPTRPPSSRSWRSSASP
jgi:hypothetical protein